MSDSNKGNLSFTILGCGSSGGVPRLSDGWGECNPNNPKNYRLRCSLLIKKNSQAGETKILIDTSPDLRQQLLTARVDNLDAVLFTHAHADHMHGIDDLRMIYFKRKSRLPVWADQITSTRIKASFKYVFFNVHPSSPHNTITADSYPYLSIEFCNLRNSNGIFSSAVPSTF